MGYEHNMSFLLFSSSGRYKYQYTILLRYLVFYLTILALSHFPFNLECSHVYFVRTAMPVTTRSQLKRLKNIGDSLTEVVSSNITLLSSSNQVVVLDTPVVSADVSTSISTEIINKPSSRVSLSSSSYPDTSSLFSASLETTVVSNFENLEISSADLAFDPGIIFHNFSSFKNTIMEADCEDVKMFSSGSTGIMDMNSLFDALSAKITSETSKLSSNFQDVAIEHDLFKREVRAELDELQQLFLTQNLTQSSSSNSEVSEAVSSSSSQPPHIVSSPIPSQPATSSDSSFHDTQQKMMLMMMESFNKLSTAFSEGKQEEVTLRSITLQSVTINQKTNKLDPSSQLRHVDTYI